MMFSNEEIHNLYLKSIVNLGDRTRIENAIIKAESIQQLTIGFIGGSITEGACASSWSNNYASLTTKWLRDQFPNAKIKGINAGIGATDSIFGIHRVEKDLLQFKPDIVVIEYSVNDIESPTTLKCFEGLVRLVLESESQPAVILVFMTKKDGTNAQDMHKQIGLHYNTPMISFRDAIWPEIRAGRMCWEEVESDEVHPNDVGHYLVSKFITHYLEEIHSGLKSSRSMVLDRDGITKEALGMGYYKNAAILNADAMEPLCYGNWMIARQTMNYSYGWVADGGSKPLVFEVEASNIGVVYKKYNSYVMGRAEIRVDGNPPVLLEGHFPSDWGGYMCSVIVAENLENVKHHVEITLCSQSHPDSKGNEFMICGLLVSRE